MLDITFGDWLTVGGVDYPVQGVEHWPMAEHPSLTALATLTASTKRAVTTGGTQAAAAAKLANLACTPLYPVSDGLLSRPNLDTPYRDLETYVIGGDEVARVVVQSVNP